MPEAEARNSVVPEVRGRGAAGDDETVVADPQRPAELVGVDLAGLEIDVFHLRQDDPQRLVVPQHVADGGSDLPLREDAGRHLVEQRLEEVMVRAVDERDPHGRTLERASGKEPSEAASDDHDMVPRVAAHAHSSRSTTVWTYRARGMSRTSSGVNHPTASVVPPTSGRRAPSHDSTR